MQLGGMRGLHKETVIRSWPVSLDTNGAGARTVKRTTNFQPVAGHVELRTVMTLRDVAASTSHTTVRVALPRPPPLLIILLVSPVLVFDKIFPNWPTPDEDT